MGRAGVSQATAQGDLPQDDQPSKGCDPACLCCRGGLSRTFRADGGFEPSACGFCGGYPERTDLHYMLLRDRLDDLKQCCKAYGAQWKLKDPLRSLTLQRAQGLLQDMLDLEAGRATRRPHMQSEALDANDLNALEAPQRRLW